MKVIYCLPLLLILSHQVNAGIYKIANSPFWRDDGSFSWTVCRSNAITQGWELASIHSSTENSAIQTSINKASWIGGFQPGNAGPWVWSDGTPWNYTNWGSAEPNDYGSQGEHHVEIKNGDGKWNDLFETIGRGCVYREMPTSAPTSSPTPSPTLSIPLLPPTSATSSPTTSPTTNITPWLVGPASYTLKGGNNYFDGYLGVSNPVGSKVDLNNVVVELFDFNCVNEKEDMDYSNAVTIIEKNIGPSPNFRYKISISQSNIGDDTGGFVFATGASTGDVKFCTRVSTYEGSIVVAFRETNFVLSYNLTNNNFSLDDIQIRENAPDSFITDVDTQYYVDIYQCNNFIETTPAPQIQQDENLVICLEPQHLDNMAHVVHISNFNIKIFAGSTATNDYVEYNPVSFGTDGWNHDPLTIVSKQPSGDVIMISTPVIAQFFIQGHTDINVSGNCFLEFDSMKVDLAPVFIGYDMQFGVIDIVEETCLGALMKRIRSMF